VPDRTRLLLQLTVDLAILTAREDHLNVLVIERDNPPFRGQLALPGGFLRAGEDLHGAAVRELAEETGLDGGRLHLDQLGAYGQPDRDLPLPVAGSDARSARWVPVEVLRGALAFDHNQILDEAVEAARSRLELTTLATAFCEETFTIGDLRHVYEVVWGVPLDPRNFSRKVVHTDGFVVATGDKRIPETGRPAALYRAGPARLLSPPLLRGGPDHG
jgi:8-oxo-dGTP diphosphatase